MGAFFSFLVGLPSLKTEGKDDFMLELLSISFCFCFAPRYLIHMKMVVKDFSVYGEVLFDQASFMLPISLHIIMFYWFPFVCFALKKVLMFVLLSRRRASLVVGGILGDQPSAMSAADTLT